MYEKVCKDRFDKLESLHNETIGLLRGRNGDPGLLDDMRTIKDKYAALMRKYKTVRAAVFFVLGGATLELISLAAHYLSKHLGS
jgi:hypothetical protein